MSGTSATVGGLAPSASYTFTVRARDAAGNASAASNSVAATTDPGGGGGTGFKQAAPYLYLGWGDPPSAATWTQIRDWANSRHIARLAFWSVNRDRPCPGGGVTSICSGISQSDWQFTSITAGFTG